MGENSQITFDQMYRGFAKIVVNKGNVRFKHRLIPLQAASETGVAPITKGTDYGMAYYPESKQTIIEIYDGEIDIADLNTKKFLQRFPLLMERRLRVLRWQKIRRLLKKSPFPNLNGMLLPRKLKRENYPRHGSGAPRF